MLWTNNKKIGIPLKTPRFTIQKWDLRGLFIARTCCPDVMISAFLANIAILMQHVL